MNVWSAICRFRGHRFGDGRFFLICGRCSYRRSLRDYYAENERIVDELLGPPPTREQWQRALKSVGFFA